MQSRAERGLTLMHATPVAASQVEDEASPLLMCASASFSLFQAEEIVPRLGRCCGHIRPGHFSRIGSLSIVSLHDPTIMIHDLSVDPPNACHSNLEAPLKTVPSCPSQLYLTFPCTTVLALQC
ncbi:hypothetical protein FocTR4_00005359 [Fusarium oxysporum f. sp. cubense]|uniref:Uncharacterized protein n=1 Tax=Fusarium oxysporum f. sp. cubense TaxID=61366 RepID=A0A5C6TEM3_FUSOC|nr:hypothetical protein FocTR4_00005359 [Fusarium oxysporum f. sp. cubense]